MWHGSDNAIDIATDVDIVRGIVAVAIIEPGFVSQVVYQVYV